MDVAISMIVGTALMSAMLLLAYAIVRDIKRMDREQRFYESQNRLMARLEALPPDTGDFWEKMDEYRSAFDAPR